MAEKLLMEFIAALTLATPVAAPIVVEASRTTERATSENGPLWPLAIYGAATVALVASLAGMTFLLGQRHRQRTTGQQYESGMLATGTARMRFDVKFYLVGILFVVFDLEAVYLFAWAISVRELGWTGYIEVLVFVGILLASLVYLWKSGALEWAPRGRHRRQADVTDGGKGR